jgi:transcription elongation factor GreA
MQKYPITPEGLNRMNEELSKLKNSDRPRIIQAIAEAKAQGDLSENAEYTSAKEEQGMIEAKISDFESKVSTAEVIDPVEVKSDKVQFGATVTLVDSMTDSLKKYKIVGDFESDLSKGYISIFSPLANAMLGKKVGDEVESQTPKGLKFYEVNKIEYVN